MKYLHRHRDTYYFRARIPQDLQQYTSKRIIKKSLQTKDIRFAKTVVINHIKKFNEAIILLRNVSLTNEQRDELLSAMGIDINNASSVSDTYTSIKLSDLITEFIKEKNIQNAWCGNTRYEYEAFYLQLIDILGDKEVKDFNRNDLTRYMMILNKFPSNLNKRKELREMGIPKLMKAIEQDKITGYPRISNKTININLARVSSLFRFAVERNYIHENPAQGLKVKSEKKARDERAAYTSDDLRAMLNSPVFKTYDDSSPEKFWIPLIALYTGARLREIAQLYKEDITIIDGIVCFDFNDNYDKTIKTSSSIRTVPVSPELIRMGFMNYVEAIQHERLWPNLVMKRSSYGHHFSKWFGRYNRKYITQDTRKVFHSFRHSFTDNLKQQLVPESLVDELTGHVTNTMSYGRYGQEYSVQNKLEAIELLDYDIDLSSLYKSVQ